MNQLREFWRLLSEHSNGLEMLQTTLAFMGLVFAVLALMDAVRDSMSLTTRGRNGPRRIIASDNIYTEVERIIVQLVLFLIGFSSVFLPPPFHNSAGVTSPELLQHTLTRLGLIAITIWKAAMSIRARRARIAFNRQLVIYHIDADSRSELAPPPGQQID